MKQHKLRSRMATEYALRMALCIECSPAVQEVPGLILSWDATFSDDLCKGCRWLLSSLYKEIYQFSGYTVFAKATFKGKDDIQKQRRHSESKDDNQNHKKPHFCILICKDDIQKQRWHSKCKDDIQKAKMTFKTIKKALVLYTHMQRRHSKAKMTFQNAKRTFKPFPQISFI